MTPLIPVLVTAPAEDAVTLPSAKKHCRVDHDDEDELISSLIAAAVAHLDGWRGVLGRAIMPQTWSITVDAAGDYILPMPDVTEASIDGSALTVTTTAAGPMVTTEAAGTIEFACTMRPEQLPAVRAAILLLVGHWYVNREAAGAALSEVPMAASMLLGPLRWRHV
ncbi:head-tail connector protein [Sedimentimonas flavescens]|uniref:Head-tail connector protein n=1 Tax=Sedimentimonas flavescens TaxID=2851012 RepID=A0ABT2ZV33_9RHOB|nr:head-tail connector protein [Sedimentimonas flavescens]MCV2877604.1 head-tail connector protein [Sedimentimonas flavescens]